ncbi:hypothetical protein GOODEAATRI_027702 [Goodea atripinnis]|uniref:Uncharacterized protein n=1 Tax=Goodea atripinnis TaxID=208336 RepID=A0ABV0NNQ6_9TELE
MLMFSWPRCVTPIRQSIWIAVDEYLNLAQVEKFLESEKKSFLSKQPKPLKEKDTSTLQTGCSRQIFQSVVYHHNSKESLTTHHSPIWPPEFHGRVRNNLAYYYL